ncbi:MAG: hypothetical protein ACI4F1_03085 [Bariatricus sp.]
MKGLSPERIADQLEVELSDVQQICRAAESVLDCDEEKIVESLLRAMV